MEKIQDAVRKNDMVPSEVLELLKIKSCLINQSNKIAVIESAVLAETLLREYSIKILEKLGFSKNNLKNLKDELSFNTMLNVIFPITIPKNSAKKLQKHINAINRLRKMRNDVVHRNISETEIEEKDVREGIESVIKIIALIKAKLKVN